MGVFTKRRPAIVSTETAADLRQEPLLDGNPNGSSNGRTSASSADSVTSPTASPFTPSKTKISRAGEPLPLGVDIHAEGLGLVAARRGRGGNLLVTDAQWIPIPDFLEPSNRLAALRTAGPIVKAFVQASGLKKPLCILSINGSDVISKKVERSKKMSATELSGLAMVKAETLKLKYTAAERAMGIDALPDGHVLISVTRKQSVTARADFARALGLKPITVEPDWCAWQRALPTVEAILDMRDRHYTFLSIFGQLINQSDSGVAQVEPGLTYALSGSLDDDQVANKIGNAFLEMFRDRGFDIQTLAVLCPSTRLPSLLQALNEIHGLTIVPVEVGGIQGACWALAFGLVQWKQVAAA